MTMNMRDILNVLTETDAPVEKKFCVREIERGDGQWLWQYGNKHGDTVRWSQRTFKNQKGAVVAAQRIMMNPNSSADISSAYFKDPIVCDRLPITSLSNPYCMD